MLRRRAMMAVKKSSGPSILPDGYQQVEYLQNTGSAYIITNISANQKASTTDSNSVSRYSCDVDFSFDSYNSAQNSNLMANFGPEAGNWIGYNKTPATICMGTASGTFFTDKDLTRHAYHWSWNGTRATWLRDDGVSISRAGATSVSGSRAFGLFNFVSPVGGAANYYFRGKLYSCKLYKNDALVLDLYPCYRTSDNAGGLYDLVQDRFFPNDGSGSFVCGPEV